MFKRTQADSSPTVVSSLLDLIQAWWSKDRVRASPREGRLLRISPGSVLIVDGAKYEVLRRGAIDTAEDSVVRYYCECNQKSAELCVTTSRIPSIRFVQDSIERELAETDLEVWGREERVDAVC